MSIADQDVLGGLVQNLALFALATIVYLQTTAALGRLRPEVRQVIVGLVFGGAAILGMIFPLHLPDGVIIDGRTIMIGLAAPFGGPVTAFVAAAIAGAYRLWLGGAGAAAGTAGIVAAAAGAVLFMRLLRRRRIAFSYRHLPAFSLLIALLGQTAPVLLVLPNESLTTAIGSMMLPLCLISTAGTTLFGALLLRERQRRDRDARYQSVVESLREAIFMTDARGRWSFLSPGWQEITGQPVDETIGEPWLEFIHPEDRGLCRSDADRWRAELRCRTRDGAWRWVEIHARQRCDEMGVPLGMAGTLNDIDARKSAENAARASEERLEGLLSRMPKIIFCSGERGSDPQGYRTGARIYGADAAEMIGTVTEGRADIGLWYDSIHPEDRPRYMELERRRKELGEPYTIDFRFIHPKTGELRWMRETAWRISDSVTGQIYCDSYILDITSEKQAARHLQELARRADSANRAKSDFLATMSHEIRTPLNAIIGFSDVMQHEMFGPLGTSQYKTYAADIHNSGVHLLRLINDILDLSKIEAGKLELHPEPVDAAETARTCLRLVADRARSSGISLLADLPPDLPLLEADERALKQIILNLLSNAVKFTPAGGTVSLSLAAEGDGFVFRVTDTGIGMAPQDIPRAMAAFGQVDNVLSRKYDGTGLGLPLVRSLTELHGGTFTLESALKVGTTATVRLPRSQARLAA